MNIIPMTEIKSRHNGRFFKDLKVLNRRVRVRKGIQSNNGKFALFLVEEDGYVAIYRQVVETGNIEILDSYSKYCSKEQATRIMFQTMFYYDIMHS